MLWFPISSFVVLFLDLGIFFSVYNEIMIAANQSEVHLVVDSNVNVQDITHWVGMGEAQDMASAVVDFSLSQDIAHWVGTGEV